MHAVNSLLALCCRLSVHCGYKMRPTAKVSEQVNRKCPLGTRFYNFQRPYIDPIPSNFPPTELHNFTLLCWPLCLCRREIVWLWKVLLSGWWLLYDWLFLSDSCASCLCLYRPVFIWSISTTANWLSGKTTSKRAFTVQKDYLQKKHIPCQKWHVVTVSLC